MKKVTLFLIAAFCLSVAACSKDAEVNAFIAEFDSTTKEMISKIDANPSAEGIDSAQNAFDGKKASLKAKFDAIKDAVGFQVGSDTKKNLEDTVKKDMNDLLSVTMKHAETIGSDAEASQKFQKLMTDLQNLFPDPNAK